MQRFPILVRMLVVVVGLSGCSSSSKGDCSGNFCVQTLSGSYRVDRCPADAAGNCTYATVAFTAADGARKIRDPGELSVSMTVNDHQPGDEGKGSLSEEPYALVVQLLLDRSFSVSESGSTEAVRAAVLDFIDSLPSTATVEVTQFASEGGVPLYFGAQCAENQQIFVDKATAKEIVTDCYQPYAASTSASQTKLFDAVGGLLPGPSNSPNVIVVFTDGADTASTQFKTAGDARDALQKRVPVPSVYAIGLGPAPNADDLNTLSDHHFTQASDKSGLAQAFSDVSSELKTVFSFRVLVAGPESNPVAHLKVTHDGKTVETNVDLAY